MSQSARRFFSRAVSSKQLAVSSQNELSLPLAAHRLQLTGLLDFAGDEPEVESQHEQREQDDRQRDADRERSHGAVRAPLVHDDEVERRTEARDDEDQKQDDDDFHELNRSSSMDRRGSMKV